MWSSPAQTSRRFAAGDTLPALGQAPAGPAISEDVRYFVEIGFQAPNVDPAWQNWHASGVPMLTEPVKTPFGRIFEARDPDGYHLNLYELSRPV